jgi:hypothetical protein
LTYYTQPPEASKPTDTQIVTQLGKAFDIDDLFKEETKMFDEIDDTKIVVDGIETKPASPTKINPIYNLITNKKVEDDEDIDGKEELEEKKSIKNGKKIALKPRFNKKNIQNDNDDEEDDDQEDDESEEDTRRNKNDRQTADKSKLKRKSCEIENDEEIYESENIPRTKKIFKMELKKKAKKEKRNGM